MKKYQVILTAVAERDIDDLYDYIVRNDAVASANYVLDELEKLILGLDNHPERGNFPPELVRQGIKDYREVFFKPYRAIYEVIGSKVIVHLCVDGRRDMKALLDRRLLR